MSVVVENVPELAPPDLENATASPPEVSELPLASFADRVTVTLLPDTTLAEETLTRDWASDAPPGMTITVGKELVTAAPPTVAPIVVGEPETKPLKVAVYVPLLLSVVAEIVPVLVPPALVNTTVLPPEVSEFPAASLAVRVSVTLLPEATLEEEADTRDCANE